MNERMMYMKDYGRGIIAEIKNRMRNQYTISNKKPNNNERIKAFWDALATHCKGVINKSTYNLFLHCGGIRFIIIGIVKTLLSILTIGAVVAMLYGLSFSVFAGLFAIVCFCFGFQFSWKLAFGFYMILLIFKVFFCNGSK